MKAAKLVMLSIWGEFTVTISASDERCRSSRLGILVNDHTSSDDNHDEHELH